MASGNPRTKPAVLVLSGIGLTAGVAARVIAALKPRLHVIAAPLDEPVHDPDDAIALLDEAGIDHMHLVGLSFGGVIAQHLAIRHPDRVASLVLGATSAGGELYTPPERAVREFAGHLGDLPAEEGLWATVPYAYAPATRRHHAPRIGQDIAHRLTAALDPRRYRQQHTITRAHDAGHQLTHITAPTLVLHGEHDRLVPPENGRSLAKGINGARYMPVRGGAHAFPTDVPDANEEIVRFVLEHSRRRASPNQKPRQPSRTSRATRA